MPLLQTKPAASCAYDIAALGEVMLRLDPGFNRVRTTRRFDVWDSGAEYNVARAFAKGFGLRGALVSAFADNEVGRLLEDIILSSKLDLSFVQWKPYDGIGANTRNGLNFAERGIGVRGALGCVDRANTAISQLRPQDIDLDELFVRRGVRWFHTGGIMAGLSEQAAQTTLALIRAAKASGAVVSYDLNYRPTLWKVRGGIQTCREVNRACVAEVDVVLGNEEDFSVCLGLDTAADESFRHLDVDAYKAMVRRAATQFPRLQAVGVTLRQVVSATVNDWGALAWLREGDRFAEATWRPGMEIFDRLGGGDSFASGFCYGLMYLDDLTTAVEYGAANGALAQTTPGDTTTATLAEVAKLAAGASARVTR